MVSSDMARIAVQKSLCKTSNGKVYLEDGTEFQIQLFNPTTSPVGVDIRLNGKSLGSVLIIRPGQRIWLERYFNTDRKFKYEVYTVDAGDADVDNAIADNGKVEVVFYKEKETKIYPIYEINTCWNTASSPSFILKDYTVMSQGIPECSVACQNFYSSVSSCTLDEMPVTKETGRIGTGGASSQKFKESDIELEDEPFGSIEMRILPMSQKPMTASDVNKRYCTRCGKRLNPKFKYCPVCGAKVE